MAYDGEELRACHINLFRNKDFNLIVVSGSPGNVCHHALINFGGRYGYYAHVAGHVYYKPAFMDEHQYQRYLRENSKNELLRRPLMITNSHNFFFQLEQLLSKKWFWGILIHNCASFVIELARAGGVELPIPVNCPTFTLPPDWLPQPASSQQLPYA